MLITFNRYFKLFLGLCWKWKLRREEVVTSVFACVVLYFLPGQRLMRYECILPSSVVLLGITVKVNLCSGEWVHGWRRQGHVSPACPIWFRGLCSTFRLLFLSNLCTWGVSEEKGKLTHYPQKTCNGFTHTSLHTAFPVKLFSVVLGYLSLSSQAYLPPCSLFLFLVCWPNVDISWRHQNLWWGALNRI